MRYANEVHHAPSRTPGVPGSATRSQIPKKANNHPVAEPNISGGGGKGEVAAQLGFSNLHMATLFR